MVFETINALRAYNPASLPVNNEVITVLSYYVRGIVGDSGGGEFYWDSTSMAADDGGMVIKMNVTAPAAAGRWKRPDNVTVNVRQFGARGDNTGDDAPFIQKAMDYARVERIRRKVFFPNGTYRTSKVDITGVWAIQGESPVVVLQGLPNQDIFYWQFPGEANYKAPMDIFISDLTFYLNANNDVSQNFMRVGFEGERIGNCAVVMPGDIGQTFSNITVIAKADVNHTGINHRHCAFFFGGPPYKLTLSGKIEFRDIDYGLVVGATDKVPLLEPCKVTATNGATGTFTCTLIDPPPVDSNGDGIPDNLVKEVAILWDINETNIPELKRRRRYYLVNRTATTFQLSATSGGAPILFTDPGDLTTMYAVPAGASTITFACDEWSSEHLVIRSHRVAFSVPNITQSIFGTFGCQSTRVSVRSLVFASNNGAFQPHTFTFSELYTEGPFDTAYMNNKEYALLEGEYINVGSGPRCRGAFGAYITIGTNHSKYGITAIDDQNKVVITGDNNYVQVDSQNKDTYIVDQGVGNVVQYARYDAGGDTTRFLSYLNRKSLNQQPGGAWPDYLLRGSADAPYQNDATLFFYGQAQMLFNAANIAYEYRYDDATLDMAGYLRWPVFPTALAIRKGLGSNSENLAINRFFPKSRWVLYAKVRSRVASGTDNMTIGVNKVSGTSGANFSRVTAVGTAWQVINVEVDHRAASDDFMAEFYVKGATAGLDFAYFMVVPFAVDTFTIRTNFGGNVLDITGNGEPEGVVTAAPGSTFRRTDDVAVVHPRFFIKSSGTGNTGWLAL